jgi:hypothetical protein
MAKFCQLREFVRLLSKEWFEFFVLVLHFSIVGETSKEE